MKIKFFDIVVHHRLERHMDILEIDLIYALLGLKEWLEDKTE